MSEPSPIQRVLEQLAGKDAPFSADVPEEALRHFESPGAELGYSQLNELLLLFGFDRVTHAFFQFLLDGSTDYTPGDALSFEQLENGVRRFREKALLLYGNVKFAFKSLSRDADLLISDLAGLETLLPEEFSLRHLPILPVRPIPAEDAYLTGYLIERELRERIQKDPSDEDAQQLESKRLDIVERAKQNHQAYLASDHLDVYVATSMRERHEFLSVNRLACQIFEHESLSPLNLRWFDPTQAYCPNRIDKGLAEALMLRRATCTIYLAQETDTLGKDSELASTLAQGKPVIAYLPDADDAYIDEHLEIVQAAHRDRDRMQQLKLFDPKAAWEDNEVRGWCTDPSWDRDRDQASLMLEQLKLFDPKAAWEDNEVRGWCTDPSRADLDALRSRLGERIKSHYDGRAETLREIHPLGIQVNLGTGVANGVLVVRSVPDCAKLVRHIVTRTLELELEESEEYTVLREKISGCIFRVMTSDAMLTNTFWNFYLDPTE